MKRLDIINSLTIYGHIITAKQRTIIQQYGDWYTMAVDGWAVTFVQRGGTWSDCGPAHSPPRCIKCNSPPINGQCTNFISFDVALLLLNSEGLIRLLCSSACYLTTHCIQIGRTISCGYSVCLSVRLLHSWTTSKRIQICHHTLFVAPSYASARHSYRRHVCLCHTLVYASKLMTVGYMTMRISPPGSPRTIVFLRPTL